MSDMKAGEEELGYNNFRCFRFNKLGHIAKFCKNNESMECNIGEHFCGNIIVPRRPDGSYPYVIKVKVNGKYAEALADSGGALTLVTPELLADRPLDYGLETRITCIHGDIKHYPTAVVSIELGTQVMEQRVGIVSRLPHQVILGRDIPGFKILVQFNRQLAKPEINLEVVNGPPEHFPVY